MPNKYIQLYKTVKRVLLGINDSSGPYFYFTTIPGQRDTDLVLNMLYKEATQIQGIIRALYLGQAA